MTDREKVIKGLEYHFNESSIGKTYFGCPYCGDNQCETQLIADTVALLKEQEAVVRCKDCKNRFDGCCYNRKSDRTNFGVFVADDWFCGDGERKVSRE